MPSLAWRRAAATHSPMCFLSIALASFTDCDTQHIQHVAQSARHPHGHTIRMSKQSVIN